MVLRTCTALGLLCVALLPAWGHAPAAEHELHDNGHDHNHRGHDHSHDHEHDDMQDLMAWVLDPAAGVIWRSAGSITTMEGTEDLAPTTAEGWDRVRHAASVIGESGYLLMRPDRQRDDEDWGRLSEAMTEIGRRTFIAAEQRDAEAIFDLGGELYQACLACHQRYLIDEQPDLMMQ